jgi:hypothetical protein
MKVLKKINNYLKFGTCYKDKNGIEIIKYNFYNPFLLLVLVAIYLVIVIYQIITIPIITLFSILKSIKRDGEIYKEYLEEKRS